MIFAKLIYYITWNWQIQIRHVAIYNSNLFGSNKCYRSLSLCPGLKLKLAKILIVSKNSFLEQLKVLE